MRSFPDKSLKEIIVIAKESYAGFVLVVADFFDIPYLNKDNLRQWISIEGLDNYTEACKEGKGVLIFSAHFGNWEIGNAVLAIVTQPFIFVYRVFDSPLLEKVITGVRASYGNISLSKYNAMRPMIRLLKNGATINILIDQNVAGYEGVFVDFFGRKACTTPGLALLALHTKAPVLPVFTRRLPDGKYLLEIGKKVEIVNSGNRDADVLINTQNFTKIIEKKIRQYPEQWFWVHQRWKTKFCQVKQKG
jgi:KDO2-lipid IV(A) lauroyltransferase